MPRFFDLIVLLCMGLVLTSCKRPPTRHTSNADPVAPAAPVKEADPCEPGQACDPLSIPELPARVQGDTRRARDQRIDTYACAPEIREAGPELHYTLQVPARGVLRLSLVEVAEGADVDLHVLSPDGACLGRGHQSVRLVVEPGPLSVVVDSFTDADGVSHPGAFTLDARLVEPLGEGHCAFEPLELPMRWRACAEGIDCFENEAGVHLRTPVVGPVVKEAHLVTVEDVTGGALPEDGWPSSKREGLEAHAGYTEAATGYEMDRVEPWAPEGEGGSRWGQAAYSRPLPVVDEAWYVTLNWRTRPRPGTRMLITNPQNGRAAVAVAGYETGPGAPSAVAGVSEEIHHHLGTGHRDVLQVGFAFDQTLPPGPIECP